MYHLCNYLKQIYLFDVVCFLPSRWFIISFCAYVGPKCMMRILRWDIPMWCKLHCLPEECMCFRSNTMLIKMLHYTSVDDIFQYDTSIICDEYWAVVLWLDQVSFLDDRHHLSNHQALVQNTEKAGISSSALWLCCGCLRNVVRSGVASAPVDLSACRFRRRLLTQVCLDHALTVISWLAGEALSTLLGRSLMCSFVITDLNSMFRFFALLKLSVLMNPSWAFKGRVSIDSWC